MNNVARNTCQILADSFLRLMENKDLDNITVQELAKEANVNKKTFYYHYHSLGELLDWICYTQFFRFTETEGVNADNWQENLSKIIAAIREHQKYFSIILQSSYSAGFMQSVSHIIEVMMEGYVKDLISRWESEHEGTMNITRKQLEYLSRYHTMAFFGVTQKWFFSDMDLSEEEFTTMFFMLSHDSIFQTLEHMAGLKS